MSITASRVPSDEDLQANSTGTTVLAYEQAFMRLEDAIHTDAAHDVEARKMSVRADIEAVTSLYLDATTRQRLEGKDRLAELYGHVIGRVLRINLLEPLRHSWHEIADGEGASGESKGSSGDPTPLQVSLSA